ncbi:hypothetical protein FNF27_04281 [Cafeteria roenbergensis]|uniref:Calmodulin-lysine N-methyltransferase n=1 Tax=Cafeteria roenbergensis TaxID=33653 RepID=A0A5A8CPG2_CAFRO|nr:hypothetical protein FNF29_02713 [Cafeteria roenbergensis]KAA0174269.1 hypothetical protein FNF27_04281 [Cafeteria roenbergensis]|eukprot:KAA0154090.1 hypothetical protein FNF29_02713 [Cafeteria roenbergensis]
MHPRHQVQSRNHGGLVRASWMLRAGMAQQAAAAALAAMVAGNADCALEAGALGTQQLLAKLSAGVLSGRDVLEIGAGMGLTGIVAAGQARRAVLSDFNWAVLCNLRRNIALNGGELCFEPAVATAKEGAEDEGAGQVDASSGDAGVGGGATRSGAAASGGAEGSAGRSNALRDGLVDAQWLDWDALPGSESPRTASCPADFDDASSGRFDAVIATDMVISLSDCRGVARVCATCLRPGGFAVFAVAPPDVRFGTEHLGPALEAAGLAVTKQTVAPRFAVSGGGEAAAATGGGYEARIVMYCAVKPPAEA